MREARAAVAVALAVSGTLLAGPAAAKSPALVQASVVAHAAQKLVPVYASPTAKRPLRVLRNPTPQGGPLVFLVKSRVPGWEQVRLAVRPNGSTGWVRDSALTLELDPYRVVVSLSRHDVTVWNDDRKVLQVPAGVGRTVLPTPRGTYYITELLKQPDPAGFYGPYAFGLSAFSYVLYHYGGGDGEVGLHGTDNPAGLGTDVSHGCIRVSNDAITKLAAMLPLGTPVVIAP